MKFYGDCSVSIFNGKIVKLMRIIVFRGFYFFVLFKIVFGEELMFIIFLGVRN